MGFKRKMTVLALLGALSLGGVGAATAFIINDATQTGTITADQAFIAKFGTTTIANIDSLSQGQKEYREVTVDFTKSATVQQNLNVTFDLSVTKGNIQVRLTDVHSFATTFEEGDAIYTLNSEKGQQIYTLSSSISKTYYLEFSVSGQALGDIEGALTITLSQSVTE